MLSTPYILHDLYGPLGAKLYDVSDDTPGGVAEALMVVVPLPADLLTFEAEDDDTAFNVYAPGGDKPVARVEWARMDDVKAALRKIEA